jgi:head-tail adaptor
MRFKGSHTEKVTLQKREVSFSASNDTVEDWSQHDRPIFAEFFERQAKEGLTEGQVVVIQDVRCRIRFIGGLNERDYRIVRNGEIYDIQSIVHEGRRKAQRLMLQRRDNQ